MREQTYVCLLIGKRYSGKSTLTQKLIKGSKMPKKLIVDTLYHPDYDHLPEIKGTVKSFKNWKKGTYRLVSKVDDVDENLHLMADYLNNCFVIFEDAKRYLKPRLQPQVMRLIGDSRQRNVDIVFMYHEWDMVPLDVFRYVDFITIFKTKTSPNARKNYVPSFEYVNTIYNKVKAHKDKHYHLTVSTE